MDQSSFSASAGLDRALEYLRDVPTGFEPLPSTCPDNGLGEDEALALLAPHVLGGAAHLDRTDVLAHMDPPTPWITWATALWNARLNQNVLHRDSAPFARDAEALVMSWLAPLFGMDGGHMCSGSTLANLTAIWAARDTRGVTSVVASEVAHLSIEKAARLLGLPFRTVAVDAFGRMDSTQIGDVSNACLVLTAGTTATGEIDPLELASASKWTHIDAAWAGPLRMSTRHGHLLDGLEHADSVAISAHKWFFQPKESALVMFRDTESANPSISFGGGYLASPNIGVQGSRGAAAVSLLATLLAWGKAGMVERIDHAMSLSQTLAEQLADEPAVELLAMPKTGVLLFRPTDEAGISAAELRERLPEGMLSICTHNGAQWLRSVAANPLADVDEIMRAIRVAL